jgi:hypothetical protein
LVKPFDVRLVPVVGGRAGERKAPPFRDIERIRHVRRQQRDVETVDFPTNSPASFPTFSTGLLAISDDIA